MTEGKQKIGSPYSVDVQVTSAAFSESVLHLCLRAATHSDNVKPGGVLGACSAGVGVRDRSTTVAFVQNLDLFGELAITA